MSLRIITLILSLGLSLSLNAAADGCRHGEGGGGWGQPAGGGRGGQHGGGRHSSWQIPQEEARRLNPLPVSGESLARGWDVYEINCLRCHGVQGFGDGPDAAALKVRPAMLRRAAHHYSDGALAFMIRKGRDPMPAWEGKLSEEQIWDVINYIRFDIGGGRGHGRGGRGCDQGRGGKARGNRPQWEGGNRENCPQQEARGRENCPQSEGKNRENCPQRDGGDRANRPQWGQPGEGCDRRRERLESRLPTTDQG